VAKSQWVMVEGLSDNDAFETWRLAVPGGWLVQTIVHEWVQNQRPSPDADARGGGLTFLPDPNHDWQFGLEVRT